MTGPSRTPRPARPSGAALQPSSLALESGDPATAGASAASAHAALQQRIRVPVIPGPARHVSFPHALPTILPTTKLGAPLGSGSGDHSHSASARRRAASPAERDGGLAAAPGSADNQHRARVVGKIPSIPAAAGSADPASPANEGRRIKFAHRVAGEGEGEGESGSGSGSGSEPPSRASVTTGLPSATKRLPYHQVVVDATARPSAGAASSAHAAVGTVEDFLQHLKRHPDSTAFAYAVIKSPEFHHYNPYNLQLIDFSQLNPSQPYSTISAKGVAFFKPGGDDEFTSLKAWQHEQSVFNQIQTLPFFRNYAVWRCFSGWRRTILHKKVRHATSHLETHAFVLDALLQQALLDLWRERDLFLHTPLPELDPATTFPLDEFLVAQNQQFAQLETERVQVWIEQRMTRAVQTCAAYLSAKGFGQDFVAQPQTSFTQQAAQRSVFKRLLQFARLVDHVLTGTLVQFAVRVCQQILATLAARAPPFTLPADAVPTSDLVRSDLASFLWLRDALSPRPRLVTCTDDEPAEPANDADAECRRAAWLSQINHTAVRRGDVAQAGRRRGAAADAGGLGVGSSSSSGLGGAPGSSGIPFGGLEDDSVATNLDDAGLTREARRGPRTNALFRTELVLEGRGAAAQLAFSPSGREFADAMQMVLQRLQSTAATPQRLTQIVLRMEDEQSASNLRKFDENQGGDPFPANTLIVEDPFYRAMVARMSLLLDASFAAMDQWKAGFEAFRRMSIENNAFSATAALEAEVGPVAVRIAEQALRDEVADSAIAHLMHEMGYADQIAQGHLLDVSATVVGEADPDTKDVRYLLPLVTYFEKYLGEFSRQYQMMRDIPAQSHVGNFAIGAVSFRDAILPTPQLCFEQVGRMLPGMARDKTDLLLTQTQAWIGALKTPPSSVEEFVLLLDLLRLVESKMPLVRGCMEEVAGLYRLIELHKFAVKPTEIALFQTLLPNIRQLQETLDDGLDSRDDAISKFTIQYERDLQGIVTRVGVLRRESEASRVFTNPASHDDMGEVIAYLDDLMERLVALEQLRKKYEGWTPIFKPHIAKERGSDLPREGGAAPAAAADDANDAAGDGDGDAMRECRVDLEAKRTLWHSLQSWETVTQSWHVMPFESLDPEAIHREIQAMSKTIYTLEKQLPPNDVLPHLKSRLDAYRGYHPTISDLRNAAMRPRHWDRIQEAIGKPLVRDETLTLDRLIALHLFDFKEEIGNVSSQASSEASLEELLAKVVKSWNDMELPHLPYRDNKDVFILGALDDLQTLMEDSSVTMATIRSSRYMGPIKAEVDRIDRQLQLFSQTLEAWIACQRSWLYLESIFSAPDIQRQLPDEARMFSQVDKSFKEIMRKVHRSPNALRQGIAPGLLEALEQNNVLLDKIQTCLEDYLESKRLLFPRFYFLSNDELLEILAQTRNPLAVQPHLGKCFDAIKRLDFTGGAGTVVQPSATTAPAPSLGGKPAATSGPQDIAAMISPEGERVPFIKLIKARGNVESWLSLVEEAMFAVIKHALKSALASYDEQRRETWVLGHVGQVVMTANQILWCRDVEEALTSVDAPAALQAFLQKSLTRLAGLASIARRDLSPIQRATMGALITLDVHNRDILLGLIASNTANVQDFEWARQQRYYWDVETDHCQILQSTSVFNYGYEYLGNSPRLVITPLTDRCYLTLTGAMELNLGGSPLGPAGTGKTETVKDLAKALAKQCVVFNCSDGLDYKMMGKMFAGLAQSGAWCCFDEFNRMDIEVLSVIAQQLLTIKQAKDQNAARFLFEGREIRLVATCASFITMNPGYAGRTELPDNLKALFRPIAMMVPDYGLIAEIMLFSEGFEQAKPLSSKVTNFYKLCSEQLSKQDHYDFGLRAVKSVLVTAGGLKREMAGHSENLVLKRALADSNVPKFLAEDLVLFRGIMQDLFPDTADYVETSDAFRSVVSRVMQQHGWTMRPAFVDRVMQLQDTFRIRHGVMLVGPAGAGKTTCYQTLQHVRNALKADDPSLPGIATYALNPKAIDLKELYGETNLNTMEWKDGLLGHLFREQVADPSNDEKWTVCDGPVDALWIENMNTVLDDNKLLTLVNGERIKMSASMRMLFEVADLAVASPATVSRCGMVYMDPTMNGWQPYVESWCLKARLHPELATMMLNITRATVDDVLAFIASLPKSLETEDFSRVAAVTKLMDVFLAETTLYQRPEGSPDTPDAAADSEQLPPPKLPQETVSSFLNVLIFSMVWGLGGSLTESSQDAFDQYLRDQLALSPIAGLNLPLVRANQSLFNFCLDRRDQDPASGWRLWDDIVPDYKYTSATPFFKAMVPTTDTERYGWFVSRLVSNGIPVLVTGQSGVGKSMIVAESLNRLSQQQIGSMVLNCSAQTSSSQMQQSIELNLEKRRRNNLGCPSHLKKLAIFIDDVNMPKLDTYGSQPPIELMRQYLDFGGFYDRDKLTWKEIEDVTLVAACGLPGGSRNIMSRRFLRHFVVLNANTPTDTVLSKIFRNFLEGAYAGPGSGFTGDVRSSIDAILSSSLEVYSRMMVDVLPTPTKSHYTFNTRDLSKIIQGCLQIRPQVITTKAQIQSLFAHEASRVFHDRLVDDADRHKFNTILKESMTKNFGPASAPPPPAEAAAAEAILFADFGKRNVAVEDRLYAPTTVSALRPVLEDFLEEYNVTNNREVKLIFFDQAIEHISRIARIIRQPRGNALLLGVGGTGKQSLSRLACHVVEYKLVEIELVRSYGRAEWREDLLQLYRLAGGPEGRNVVLLLSDIQIKSESFLEDINSILNSGQVLGLIEPEEREKIVASLRPTCRAHGMPEDRDTVWQFFIDRVRDNLHIIFATSPVGETFRQRVRTFPSLVNCMTIDCLEDWPAAALLSVSKRFFEFVDLGAEARPAGPTGAASATDPGAHPAPAVSKLDTMAQLCVHIHQSVTATAEAFYAETRRRYYTTPTSFLEFINLYVAMLSEKRKELAFAVDRLKNGLDKLTETNQTVGTMQIELQALGPILKQKALDIEALMVKIGKDQEIADGVRRVVQEEEIVVREKANATEAISNDAQQDLDEALPALDAAYKALDALDKKDIAELKVFSKPPDAVLMVMEAICILFKMKPDWDTSKKLLSDPQFMRKMSEFDKDNIPENVQKKLRKYMENPAFTAEAVEKVSKAAKSMCMWVIAMDIYARVFKEVLPKRKRLEEARLTLEETRQALAEKTAALDDVENKLADLKRTYEESIASKKQLADKAEETTRRLARASKLTTALADEQVRWSESVAELRARITLLVGDIFLSAAFVAYCGAFTMDFRQQLIAKWAQACADAGVAVQQPYSLIAQLGDPAVIRQWHIDGLPVDDLSIENAILTTRARRWPLMIDPQGQANRWIRKRFGPELKVLKLSDSKFIRQLESALRLGDTVLLEDVGEALDPILEPVLQRQVVRQGGKLVIKLGDTLVEYDKRFQLFMTTKLANPHYLPEVCIQVTIINFTVTRLGLQNQLLADVVRLEKPELEETRDQLIVTIANDKRQLSEIEDRILKLLFNSSGNILDDEELIDTLNQSKVTSAAVKERVKLAEETEVEINHARQKYLPVAVRGLVIYFTVVTLEQMDTMYQFSLDYFKNLFQKSMEQTAPQSELSTRLASLCANITTDIFNNIARGLLEAHKSIFAFNMAIEIARESGDVDAATWHYFLRPLTVAEVQSNTPPRPAVQWVTPTLWATICECPPLPSLESVAVAIMNTPEMFDPLIESDHPLLVDSLGLPLFTRLVLIKLMREEKLVTSMCDYVRLTLGPTFVDFQPLNLASVAKEMSKTVPLLFILSPGSDPTALLLKYAGSKEVQMLDRLHMMSLGQGQGPIAEDYIKRAAVNGDWVYLQNAHLAASWMPALEAILADLTPERVHDNFRLFLSSMPSPVFPRSILQSAVKITNELPRGLRSNMQRVFAEISPDLFDEHPPQQAVFRKLCYSLCFMNAVIQERKKFGSLGWNIPYDWSASDLQVSMSLLQAGLTAFDEVPWAQLRYLTGQIAFGGRVTDDWDRRTLTTLVNKFYSTDALVDHASMLPSLGYSTSSMNYTMPPDGELSMYREFVDRMPTSDDPAALGMNGNAEMAYMLSEGRRWLRMVSSVQPAVHGSRSGAGKISVEDEIYSMTEDLLATLPESLDVPKASADDCLAIVLSQECVRFNRLMDVIRQSLEVLQKAIRGWTVMSLELERVFKSLYNNELPETWAAAAYPSLKPLSSWMADLVARVQFLRSWKQHGKPTSFWLSGMFFPQGLLTAVLQEFARRHTIPIDELSFEFRVETSSEGPVLVDELPALKGSVLIHGLFLENARWDDERGCLQEAYPLEMFSAMPPVRFIPVRHKKRVEHCYVCPLYKTSARAGTLSTTGHSTNFVLAIDLPVSAQLPSDHWIARGAALLCQLSHSVN